jgi:hypothetical protein
MRAAVIGIAILLLSGGEAYSADWLSWLPFPMPQSQCANCVDDSPLCPQLTYWTFQRSHCREPLCAGHRGHPFCGGSCGVVALPPLPYSGLRLPPGGPPANPLQPSPGAPASPR